MVSPGRLLALAPALLLALTVAAPAPAVGIVNYYEWDLYYETVAPDCVTKRVPTINGQTPGPPIYAVVGDEINVKLCNYMYYNASMHW